MIFFQSHFFDFLDQLAQNNYKEWFHEHKTDYENYLKNPFLSLIEVLLSGMKKEDPSLQIEPKKCLMRINKDIRFSKDKSPYHLRMAACISPLGAKDKNYPGLFLECNSNAIHVYMGWYEAKASTEKLEKIRQYLIDHAAIYQKIIQNKNFKTHFGEILGEKQKKIPAHFAAFENQLPLNYKQLYVHKQLPAKILLSKNLAETIFEFWLAGKDWNIFLQKGLGLIN